MEQTRTVRTSYWGTDDPADELMEAVRTVEARFATGLQTIEVPGSERQERTNGAGDMRMADVPGEGMLAIETGPPVFVMAVSNGPVECHPFGMIDADRPFIFDARREPNQLCPGGVRRIMFANLSPRPVRVQLEILYDVMREDLPKRKRREAIGE